MTEYDSDNIFTKIIAGDVPAHKIYEDEETLAFMDVMPESDGHCLVIPKKGSRNLLDAAPETLGTLIVTTQRIAQAAQKAMNADGIIVRQFNEAPAGQSVFHLHFHVIPCYEGVGFKPHTGQMADNDLLAGHAAKIRAAL